VDELIDPLADDGVELVAVDVEGADAQPPLGDGPGEAVARGGVGRQPGQVEVRSRRPAPGGQLDACDAQAGDGVEHLLEGQVGE